MTRTLLLRSAALAALAVGAFDQAQAQESAFDFMRNEHQRQGGYRQPVNTQPSAPMYSRGNWSAPGYDNRGWSGYAEWSPPNENPERSRATPHAHVDNPDFLNYTADRLQTKSLAKACESKTDAGPDAAPAQDFAQACAATPAVSVSVLPQVGDALAAYYAAHPHFIWVQDGAITPRALAAIDELRAADKYALDPADYRVSVPQLGDDQNARAQALLRFEFALSAKTLTYALDATRGRIDPNRISGYHDLPRKSVDLAAALDELANSSDVAASLAARNPQNAQFKALVAELARLRGEAPQEPARAPVTKSKHTQAAVAKTEGTAGNFQKIQLALEELRWLPREFGNTYVFLNQPAFEVSFIESGKAKLSMRAVVGKPSAQTYFFVDRIKDVEYNPYWNVPRSIVINEMLPQLYRNPGWLSHRGYEVANERGRQIASNSVNWAAVASGGNVEVRQPPGDGNALGRVKIEFPNKHAIYMHDTPQKHLFKNDMRALSHGCVRLERPRDMAAALLGTSVEHIDKRIASKSTEKEFVKREIPVYLAYFTAWPDAEGKVHYYGDVYDRDAHLKTALAATEAARKGE